MAPSYSVNASFYMASTRGYNRPPSARPQPLRSHTTQKSEEAGLHGNCDSRGARPSGRPGHPSDRGTGPEAEADDAPGAVSALGAPALAFAGDRLHEGQNRLGGLARGRQGAGDRRGVRRLPPGGGGGRPALPP